MSTAEPTVLRSVSPAAPRGQGARLAYYLRTRFGLSMFLANVAGGIDVFALLNWVLPTPAPPHGEDMVLRGAIAFVGFLAITFPLGGWGTYLATRPVLQWLESGGGAAPAPPPAPPPPPPPPAPPAARP